MESLGSIGKAFGVFAHRGYHGVNGVSENSLGSFKAAIDLGADAIELDVHRTRDGVLVLHHDAELADGRKLADLDFAQLPTLEDGQPIPTLIDAAELANGTGVRLSVELKEPGYEDLVAQQLANHIDMRQVEVISFNRTSVAAVKAYDPSIRTGLLEPQVPGWLRSTALYPAAMWVMDKLGIHPSLSAAARVGADFVSGEDRMVTKSLIDDAHRRGLQVYAWTVDDPKRMAELASHGVDGIVSNRPDLALAVRSGDTGTGAALAA